MAPAASILLADADILIDYRDSDLAILELVARNLGRLVVLSPVLGEVHGLTETRCVRLGIEVLAVETAQMLQATELPATVSFNDRLCLVACREGGWTCVTNDRALQRLCETHGVSTRFGLSLMVDLVAAGALTRSRALAVAHEIASFNPLHINERVLTRFRAALAAVDPPAEL